MASFHGLTYTDACDHVHYTLYNRAYFMDSRLSTKIGPLENFPLYGIYSQENHGHVQANLPENLIEKGN